jgi:hypothetical protein
MSGDKITVLYTPEQKALKEFVEDFQSGDIEHAVVIYEKNGEPMYRPFTNSEFGKFGWLLFTTMQTMAIEEAEMLMKDE